MKILVMGGSKCGKSSFAEDLATKLSMDNPLYYIATMRVGDDEDRLIVKDHLKKRAGKGFITIEKQRNISEILDIIQNDGTILIECLSNLLANEMFNDEIIHNDSSYNDDIINKVISDIKGISKECENIIAVTYNVFGEVLKFDEDVISYIKALGEINTALTGYFDEVYEVVAGIPLRIK